MVVAVNTKATFVKKMQTKTSCQEKSPQEADLQLFTK